MRESCRSMALGSLACAFHQGYAQAARFGVHQALFQGDVLTVERTVDLCSCGEGREVDAADAVSQGIELRAHLQPVLFEPAVVLLQAVHVLHQICITDGQQRWEDAALFLRRVVAARLVEKAGDNVVLIIEDDGKGFDADALLTSSKRGRGLGLFGMRERAELIGGTLEIESEPGRGTTVYVRVFVPGFTQKDKIDG